MKCVRCKIAPAVGKGCNICVPCFRKIVVKRYWPGFGQEGEMRHEDGTEIEKWRTLNLWMLNVRSSVLQHRQDLLDMGVPAKEANEDCLAVLRVKGEDLKWA